ALGRAFFGESMFSRETDASKVAMAWLVARLRLGGFELLDCQFMTDHLASLGAIEMTQAAYLKLLDAALATAVQPSSGRASSGAAGAGAGGDWGALEGSMAAGSSATASLEEVSFKGVSSPGKRILQALIQTS
ncbi:MAG: hypothetical protein RL209_1491, partial [Pseudomonadota bacterium]